MWGEFDFSPEELDQVESRSDQLYRLKKKYGATVEEMLEYLDRSRRELDEIETAIVRYVSWKTWSRRKKNGGAADG